MVARVSLSESQCAPLTSRSKPLPADKAAALLKRVPGWRMARNRLRRSIRFEDFLTAMEFINELADLAEEQGHHPDFRVSWSRLDLELWSHSVKGLTKNDFILAAKINDLLGERA